MAKAEFPPEISPETVCRNRILNRLNFIGSANYSPISANAKWVLKDISNERIFLETADPKKLVLPGAVDFKVRRSPFVDLPEGVLTFDSFRTLSVKDEVLDSELVRSLSVAVQYPGMGYCRPLRLVYSEALMLQEQWLNAMEVRGTLLDPRVLKTDIIIRNLVGEDEYEFDFGLSHWDQAIEDVLANSQFIVSEDKQHQIRKLRFLRGDTNAFILARLNPFFAHARNPLFGYYQKVNHELDESFESTALKSAIVAVGLAMRELE